MGRHGKENGFIMDIAGSQKGIALLVTLWLLVILTVMVLSFSLLVRTESHATLAFKEGVENKFLAEAGIQRGIAEIIYRNAHRNQNIVLEGKEIFSVDGTPYTGRVGDGWYRIRITGESGKIDLNALTDATGIVLNNLLVGMGVAKAEADIIVDAILDWKDADDLHRLHGAESEYYQSLPNPYRAKNAPFDTVEELSLVRGVTPEILYGSGKQKGLIDHVTVHSGQDRLNINHASRELIMAIPGMTEDIAAEIVNARQAAQGAAAAVPEALQGARPAAFASFAGGGESGVFTIDSLGYGKNEKKGYAVRATVIIDGSGTCRYLYYKSPMHVQ